VGPLLHDAGLSWLHFLFAFVLVGALMAEAFILRLPVDGRVARLLLRVDLFYGLSAALVIIAGVSRVAWGAAGWDFYRVQPFFWAKMATLFVIAVASALPTFTFLRWSREFAADAAFAPDPAQVKRVRTIVLAEAHLVALLLLFAALMARGVGQP
jgi:putative membrane protein